MDQWKKKSLREEQFQQGTISPSFSSTLLDSIYRSIDEGCVGEEEEQRRFHRETMKKKQSTSNNVKRGGGGIEKKEMETRDRRASMMDKWMMLEKNKETRRKSLPDFDRKVLPNNNDRSSMFIHSTSSSSDSSSGGGFSSSEAESVYGSRSRSSSVPIQRPPKPVRTSVSVRPERNETHHHQHQHDHHQQRIRFNSDSLEQQQQKSSKKHNENGFIRTKSRALKIYGDLKKVKQPISPGGRLATFINSLFHAKKQRKNSTNSVVEEDFRSERKSKSTQTSTCSSASSFSRSCLSKAPSSNNGIKRTVRFYPVSVIVDEDSRPCGEKSLYEDKTKPNNLIMSVDESRERNQRRIQEAARDLIVSYRKNSDFSMRDIIDPLQNNHDNDDVNDDDDDDDEDAASYASSDLFELDNLASIGIDHRYSEELPVYETTHFQMNRAIANGFIL